MNLLKRGLLLSSLLGGGAINVLAQGDDAGAACGALGCVGGGIIYLLFLAIVFGGVIALVVFIIKFIRKDAIARGMPNADSIKWLGLLGLIGLLIYLLQRPQGNITPCPSCGQNRMEGLQQCPQCGNA
ncbi:MAG TPA: hypothetical protein VN643_26280 [Pyrinomonadaceae bacterium]|nr:hypothetical protein [Pyrinomonadaceae bacterium]